MDNKQLSRDQALFDNGVRLSEENAALRHDIERQIAVASKLATENEELRAEISRLREENAELTRSIMNCNHEAVEKIAAFRDRATAAEQRAERLEKAVNSIRYNLKAAKQTGWLNSRWVQLLADLEAALNPNSEDSSDD